MRNNPLFVLTPTGDRLTAFKFCIDYMNRQTLKPDLWIIVDDSKNDDYSSVLEYIKIPYQVLRLPPMDSNSLVRNVTAGLELIKDDNTRLVFMEDDDWYPENYLEVSYNGLSKADAVGVWQKKYYNVGSRMYRDWRNHKQRCLHSLGITRSAFKVMHKAIDICADYSLDARFCDLWFGRAWADNNTALPVHITGFGHGRAGCTYAHRVPHSNDINGRWKPDNDGKKLKEWVGEDAGRYL